MNYGKAFLVFFSLLTCGFATAFVSVVLPKPRCCLRHKIQLQEQQQPRGTTGGKDTDPALVSRRTVLGGVVFSAAAAATTAAATIGVVVQTTLPVMAATPVEETTAIPITPFNGLIFNYRGSDYGGLDASTLTEPSVPYKEFAERLVKGDVEFVEFLAPHGDVAYVTFKTSSGSGREDDASSSKPIRIGEGYPIEKHDGWSSPTFVIRTVKNYGVPYKFTTPALAAYKP